MFWGSTKNIQSQHSGAPYLLVHKAPEDSANNADETQSGRASSLTHRTLVVTDPFPLIMSSSWSDANAFVTENPRFEGLPISLVSRVEIIQGLSERYRDELSWEATHKLRETDPDASAAEPFPLWQVGLYLAVFPFFALLFGFFGVLGAQIAAMLFFPLVLAAALLRIRVLLLPGKPRNSMLPTIPDEKLPMLSVLVPVFRETRSIPTLLAALSRLNYPAEKLEIFILLEEVDSETIEAVTSARLPSTVIPLIIPNSQPRTKPKAMNYALPLLRGEIVCIFDAEDVPEPDQPLKAAHALTNAESGVECVQASLNHYNRGFSWLTRCASMEYAMWFDRLLERLGRLGLPVPLGGTSLYIRGIA